MHPSYDIAVIGAGIVGAACALEFAQAGLRVALIESQVIGGGATAAGMGHIAVMDDSEAQFALTRYSQLLWKDLAPRLPPQAEYLPCGALWVAADDEEMDEVVRKQRYYTERGAPVEILDAHSLATAEPNLRPGLVGGLLVHDDSVVYSPSVALFLVEEAERLGMKLLLGHAVTRLHKHEAMLDNNARVNAELFVLATGAAAGRLAETAVVQPRKGHLLITDRYPGFVRHQIIELGYLKSAHSLQADSVAFNVQPRATGQLLIGSSRQYGVTTSSVQSDVMTAMLERAFLYMPGLRTLSAIRTWTGFRAATPDKLPLIGACPGKEHLFLATGHEGLGITTSLGTAKLLADLILNRQSSIVREPYLPDRSYASHV